MDIALTGARAGEKLHEELAYAAEMLAPTRFAGIHAWQGQLHAGFEAAAMLAELAMLRNSPDKNAVVVAIRRHVPEMRPVEL